MSLTAAFLLIAQSAAPAIVDAPRSQPVAGPVTATASARVIRPAVVRVRQERGAVRVENESELRPQRSRDTLGTVWIEFN